MSDTSQAKQASSIDETNTPGTLRPAGQVWSLLLPSALRDRSLEMLHLLAVRLSKPEHVALMAEQAARQSEKFFWGGAAVSNSFSSLALLYLYLARSFPGEKWEELAHMYLRLAVQSSQENPLSHPGLLSGSSGFALLLSAFCDDEPRYRKMLDKTIASVVEQVMSLETLQMRVEHGLPNGDYDVVMGVSGILAFLVSLPSPDETVQHTIQKLLVYLVWLSGEDEQRLKHWFTPVEYYPMYAFYSQLYPHGYFNLGLSHGIAGPLAALCLAWQAGYRVPGQREAIEQISRWVIEHQVQDQWGINWPAVVPLEASFSPEQWSHLRPSRAAWCYGTPGIASTLWLAGTVLEDAPLHLIAVEGLEAVLKCPVEERKIDSPTICHGIAGLLAICLRFARRSNSQIIREHLSLLVTQLLDACNPSFPLGIRDEVDPGIFIDDPGFLTGAAGVALVLLAAATSVEPRWDRILLIS